jgi:hypothetical protein
MNVGFTSGVFRDPFDIGWKSLDVEVVAVEIGALLLSEIGSAYWAFLDIARTGRNNKHQFDLDTFDSGTRDSPITDTFSKAKSSTVRRCGIIAVPRGSLDTSAASARASPHHPSKKKKFLKKMFNENCDFVSYSCQDPQLPSTGSRLLTSLERQVPCRHHRPLPQAVPSAQGICWVRQPSCSPPDVVHHNRLQGG